MSEELKPCAQCGGDAQTDFIEGETYIIECYQCGMRTGWEDSPEDAIAAWNRRAPVAARELDVEAERREFAFGELLPCAAPKGPFADYSAEEVEAFAKKYAEACVSAKLGEVYSIALREKGKMDRAARSAAQGTQPESAQVSTEQAGDAWISVEDRLPECSPKENSLGVEVIIWPPLDGGREQTAFFGKRVTREPWFYKYGETLHVTHWMPLPAAPSPNNSPVGADKELK